MAPSNGSSMIEENAFFVSTSADEPFLLNVTFASDPKGSLGAQLVNCDKDTVTDQVMFVPGFAVVGKLLPGETVASKAGVKIGDVIVAVNGHGFRRFAPDYTVESAVFLKSTTDAGTTIAKQLSYMDHMVVSPGVGYDMMLTKIKAMKAGSEDEDSPPLILTLERYGWDARPNCWARFLVARDHNVVSAMQMLQNHETWRLENFPIDLKSPGLQKILRHKAVSEIHVLPEEFADGKPPEAHPPTVYVDYGKLLKMQIAGQITSDDVVAAFVIFTERMLATSPDPRNPSISQFIDLSGVSITSGFRMDTLKKIYNVFEPNYPETLHKMIMYPVSTLMGTTARTMLSFVNTQTQKKFVITSSLEKVCDELGWSKTEVEDCGGVTQFMHKHEKVGSSMLFGDDVDGEEPLETSAPAGNGTSDAAADAI